MPRIDRSLPGHSTPSPSALQNRPNALSRTPTANLMEFSGTRRSGSLSSAPTITTVINATSRAERRERDVALRRAKGQHDECNLKSLEKDRLECQREGIPIHSARRPDACILCCSELRIVDCLLVTQRLIACGGGELPCAAIAVQRSTGDHPQPRGACRVAPESAPVQAQRSPPLEPTERLLRQFKVERQPLVVPVASTTVSASTPSTMDAKHA